MTSLIVMTERHVAWLLGETAAPDALTVGGEEIAPPATLALLRRTASTGAVAWLVAEENDVVGLIAFTDFAVRDGRIEPDAAHAFGYGIVPSRRGRGTATAAVAGLVRIARARGLRGLTAHTPDANRPSQRVLEKNGFTATGSHDDAEHGPMIAWSIDLSPTEHAA